MGRRRIRNEPKRKKVNTLGTHTVVIPSGGCHPERQRGILCEELEVGRPRARQAGSLVAALLGMTSGFAPWDDSDPRVSPSFSAGCGYAAVPSQEQVRVIRVRPLQRVPTK